MAEVYCKSLVFCLFFGVFLVSSAPTASYQVVEVPYGSTVTLICGSNDQNHNFYYWHKVNSKDITVGPGNAYDRAKFRYEVLSGNLTIRAISKQEEGTYQCVSRGVRSEDINIREVRMVVAKDWEQVYEHDPNLNLFRILIITITVMVLGGLGYGGYKIWKNRYRNPHYLAPTDDEDEEDSGEEIFRAPRASSSSANLLGGSFADDDFKNKDSGISTDFKSILNTANQK